MVVRYFNLIIEGTDESKLNLIKSWINTKIEANDLDVKLGASVHVNERFEGVIDEYVLSLVMYIKTSVQATKYKDIIVNRFKDLNKTGLTSAKIIEYDNCSHDSEDPQPCSLSTVMEWNA